MLEVSNKMTDYVKTLGGAEYHWCKNCSKYPSYIAERTTIRPEEHLCDECLANEGGDDCN
jgi:hypothetical protein